MAIFVTRHDSPLSPHEAWDRLTTWPQHAKYVPLTTISNTVGLCGCQMLRCTSMIMACGAGGG